MVNLDGSRGIGRNRNDRLNSIQGHLHYIPIISQKADNGLKRHFGTKLNDCANDTVHIFDVHAFEILHSLR